MPPKIYGFLSQIEQEATQSLLIKFIYMLINIWQLSKIILSQERTEVKASLKLFAVQRPHKLQLNMQICDHMKRRNLNIIVIPFTGI